MQWWGYGYGGWGFWAVHLFWWLLWVVLVIGLLMLLTSHTKAHRRETPLEILQRRYASGELTTEEFLHRKQHLHDAPPRK